MPKAEEFGRRFLQNGSSEPSETSELSGADVPGKAVVPCGPSFGQSDVAKPIFGVSDTPGGKRSLLLPICATKAATTSASEVSVWPSGHPDPRLPSQANQKSRERISQRRAYLAE